MGTEAKRRFLIDIAFLCVVGLIVYVVFKFLSVYLLPFVIGITASFLVQRPVRLLHEKTKISKGFLTIVLVVLTYFALTAAITAIGVLIYNWLSGLAKLLPGLAPAISDAISDVNLALTKTLQNMPQSVIAYLNELPGKLVTSLTGGITTSLSGIAKRVATGAPQLLISTIVTVVASCYIAKDYDLIIQFLRKQTSPKIWGFIVDIKLMFVKNIFRILRGYLLLMIITFVELLLGFWIIGIKHFVPLAAIICVVDILPVLGTGTVVIPWALISLISGHIWTAVSLLILYLVITVIRNFLEPKVIGEQVGLHPLITLLSMFCGYKLLGFAGLFLFPIALIIINDMQKQGKIKLWKTGNKPAADGDSPIENQPQ